MTIVAKIHHHTIVIPDDIEVEDGQEVTIILHDKHGEAQRRKERWAQAAELAAHDYTNDPELTIFTAIDGDDFYEES